MLTFKPFLAAILVAVSSCQPAFAADPVAHELLAHHNAYRASVGAPPLTLNAQLCAAAQQKAELMAAARRMDHNVGGSFVGLVARHGYATSAAAENIAAGQRSASEVSSTWWHSGGHKRNMLGGFHDVGFGHHNGYWATIFATRLNHNRPPISVPVAPSPSPYAQPNCVDGNCPKPQPNHNYRPIVKILRRR